MFVSIVDVFQLNEMMSSGNSRGFLKLELKFKVLINLPASTHSRSLCQPAKVEVHCANKAVPGV